MEENKTIIGEVTEEKGEITKLPIKFGNVPLVAVLGAAKQLAGKETYIIGLGAGLLFGKKAGIKTIVGITSAGAVYNAARYLTGEFVKKD